jgi:CheY-like chemotaxis protein
MGRWVSESIINRVTKILLIEDDEILRPVLASLLRHAGYGVIEAVDGKQGLELARSAQPELVITDLVMPQREGIETIRALRGEGNALPAIIAISGATAASNYLGLASKLGARRTLLKPFKAEALLQAVMDVVGPPRPEKTPSPDVPADRPLKFVVLDDEPGPRILNRRALQKKFPGCEVVECGTIDDALGRCIGQPVDAVLADHHLGGRDGTDFVERLRHERVDCPIVMVTGSSDPQIRVKAYAAGVTRVFFPGDLDFAQYLHGLLVKPDRSQ